MESKHQIEIERKYLVDLVGELPQPVVSDILQTYLLSDDGSVRRVRRRCGVLPDDRPRFFYTAKRRIAYDRSFEHEEEIDEARYTRLLAERDPQRGTVHKQRIVFSYRDQCFELDRFVSPALDHCLLEIEGAESADQVSLPPFLRVVADVTGSSDYSNANIALRVPQGFQLQEQVSLLPFNTFGIDALARRFAVLHSVDDYRSLLRSQLLSQMPFFVLGGGSNVVFTGDFQGLVVHPANRGIRLLDQRDGFCFVEAQAGEKWDDFVRYCIAFGWHGLENMVAIPGCVGAAPVQNVGAYGREAKDVIHRVHAFDIATGLERWFDASECGFAYRWSRFKGDLKNRYLIDRVVFRLESAFRPLLSYKALAATLAAGGNDSPSAAEVAAAVSSMRDSKLPDPKVIGSAGSFFKNPVVPLSQAQQLLHDYPSLVSFPVDARHTKLAAGWLIEQCGWKGRDQGRVGVYEKQALVLVNRGGCNGSEVRALADRIADDVRSRFGVSLECEAIFV